MTNDPEETPEKPPELPPISQAGSDDEQRFSLPAPKIEGYEILEKLAEAGQGQVWKAVQLSTNRKVALKVPRFQGFGSKKAFLRFEREVQVAARLKHPHIARIYDTGINRGLYYYAMELVEGQHLDTYVKDRNLSQQQILELFKTICLAVQYAHQNAVIHRDLKPSNIIVSQDGQPHLVDFGLAKGLQEDDIVLTMTQDTEAAGTPAFMSPEQASGRHDGVDIRTDVYSLGAVLYHLLTGKYPHDLSGNRYQVLKRIAEEEIRKPRDARPDLDKELEYILVKALAQDPERRYSGAGELAQDIDNFLAQNPLIAGPESKLYRFQKLICKHKITVLVSSVFLLVLLAGSVVITVLYMKTKSEKQAAQYALYLKQITLAGSEYKNENVENALKILQQCPENFRNWEYNYLNHLADQSQITLQTNQGSVRRVLLTPDDKRIISGGDDGTIRVWDVASEKEIMKIKAHDSWLTCVRLSPDSSMLASSSEGKTVKLWNLETGALIQSLDGHTQRVNCVDFSPDGKKLVSCSVDTTVRIWELSTGKEVLRFAIPEKSVSSVVFSPEGDKIIAVTSTGQDANRFIKIWDSNTGSLMVEKSAADFSPVGVSHFWDAEIDDSGKCLLTSNWGQVCIWDVPSLELKTFIPSTHRFGSRRAAFSPDEQHIVTGGITGTLRIWDRYSGRLLRTLYGHKGPVWSVAYNSDGTRIVSGGEDGTIRIWDAIKDFEKIVIEFAHPNTPIRAVSFNCDGEQLASGGEDNQIRIWDTRTWQTLVQLSGHTDWVTSISYSPNGKYLISAGRDRSIRIWRLDTSPPSLYKVLEGHLDSVNTMACSPDGRHMASGSSDKTIKIWDLETGLLIKTLQGHLQEVNSICYADDGRQLVSGSSDKTIRLWDMHKGDSFRELKGHDAPVTCVAVSPDGRYVVSGDESGQIIVWDKDRGQRSMTMKGHLTAVTDVLFSGDSKRIFSSSMDDTIRVWAPQTNECILMLGEFLTGGIHSLSLSPDRKTIAAAGSYFGNMIIVSSGSFDAYDRIKTELHHQSHLYLLGTKALKKNPKQIPTQAKDFNGHHYLLYCEPMKWNNANAFSKTVGGHLATITSKEENDWIVKHFNTLLGSYWLGGTDEHSEGNWRWITGEAWSYDNWAYAEPNNQKGIQHGLQMYAGCLWDDECMDLKMYFLIEWDD